MFLGNVLFLTRVWGYSILRAGLAMSVGPVIVAVTAPLFGKLAGRVGQRRLLVPGGLVWASGGAAAARPRHRPRRTTSACTCPSVVLHRDRRRAVPAAAVVGLGAGPAPGPVRRRLRGESVAPLPRRDVRRRARRRLHRPAVPGDGLDGFHQVWWLLVGCGCGGVVSSRRAWCARPSCPARSSRRGRHSSSTETWSVVARASAAGASGWMVTPSCDTGCRQVRPVSVLRIRRGATRP